MNLVVRPLDRLFELVADVTAAKYAGFYRKFYELAQSEEKLDIQTLDEWRRLKPLTKKDLLATPLRERLYCAFEDIEQGIDATSGTTGGLPLFIAHTRMKGYEFRSLIHDFEKPLLVAPPTRPQRSMVMARDLHPKGNVIILDPQNIAPCVALAKAVGTRSIVMPTFIARVTADEIVRQGFADRITSVELVMGGGAITQYVLDRLPSAVVVNNYGAAEAEGTPIAISDAGRDAEGARALRANEGFFLELIHPETLKPLEPLEGVEGELVLTTSIPRPFAFPLVRYRTGDIVRVVKSEGNSLEGWYFVICGRRDLDFIRIPGGVLRSDELERALRSEFGEALETFEAECAMAAENDTGKISLTIFIGLANNEEVKRHANMIAEKIRVSPSFTYADGVRNGMYEPLSCEDFIESTRVGKPRQLKKITH